MPSTAKPIEPHLLCSAQQLRRSIHRGPVVGRVERPADPNFKPTSIFGRDMIEFPDYFNRGGRTSIGHHDRVFYCVEPLKYVGQGEVKSDIENLTSALQGKAFAEAFLPAIAPGTMEHWMKNEYYPTAEAYLFAIADAMQEEYKAYFKYIQRKRSLGQVVDKQIVAWDQYVSAKGKKTGEKEDDLLVDPKRDK